MNNQHKITRYSKHGKLLQPITFAEFEAALKQLKPIYQAYAVLIYYTGIRVTEALRLVKEDYRFDALNMYVDVGIRLKTRRERPDGTIFLGKRTKPLPLSLEQPHLEVLVARVKHTKKGQKVFKFKRATAWNQMDKAGLGYNHHARLSAVTAFLQAGHTIAEVVDWFGISVQTVNSYIGDVSLEKMGSMRRT